MTAEPEYEQQGPIIRDKRRIDPQTGQLREPRPAAASPPEDATPSASAGTPSDAEAASDLEAKLAERTADLQRLQAEYVNYKRRVDRDRESARQSTIGSVLSSLLPVLDDIARAREHAELSGGFRAVAEALERILSNLGLESFGEPGDRFDPRVHEALMHSYSDEVSEPVCQMVLQVGYRHHDKVLRPARVAVAEPPAADVPTSPDATTADLSDGEGPASPAPDKSSQAPEAAGDQPSDTRQ